MATLVAKRSRRAVVCHDGVRRQPITAALELEDVTIAAEADLSRLAFDVVDVTAPDVIVLDLTVAGLAGLAMVPRLRATAPDASILAVAPPWVRATVGSDASTIRLDALVVNGDIDAIRAALRPD